MANNNVPSVIDAASAQWGADTLELNANEPSVQVAPADPQRRSVVIVSDPNMGGIVYLTPYAGATTGGAKILPGGGFGFNTGAPVYARSEGGTQQITVLVESGAAC